MIALDELPNWNFVMQRTMVVFAHCKLSYIPIRTFFVIQTLLTILVLLVVLVLLLGTA